MATAAQVAAGIRRDRAISPYQLANADIPGLNTDITGDSGGKVEPTAGNINLIGGEGVSVVGDPSSSTLTINIGVDGSVTTVGAETLTLLTLPLDSVAAVYAVDGLVSALESTTGEGAAYTTTGSVRTNGTSAVLIGTPIADEFEDTIFSSADSFYDVSGNNFLIKVIGVAGYTIRWTANIRTLRVV